jgi:hypothetical protein
MTVHVVEDELIRSNSTRAFIVGYLLGISYDAIHQLQAHNEADATLLDARLQELYPLIEKEFYSQLDPTIKRNS